MAAQPRPEETEPPFGPSPAESSFRRAIALDPSDFAAHAGLAQLLTETGHLAEAQAHYRAALAIDPSSAQCHFSLAVLLSWQENWIEVEASLRHALALQPNSSMALDLLAHALLEQGRPEEALEHCSRALALAPDSPVLLGNYLSTAVYVPRNQAQVPPEARKFGERMAQAAPRPYSTWRCNMRPGKLRVGLVSGDLRRHAVASFLDAILASPDARLEFVAYSTNRHEDEVTAALKARFSAWRRIDDADTMAAAKAIRDDGIHVLVDLCGHTGHQRLDVFAQAPAPVQVTWLGAIATTGLARIQYLLTDPHASRPGDAVHYSEKLWPLPDAWACYQPPPDAPAVVPPPAQANGFVTFGSFNNLPKLSQPTVHTWSRVLQAVPGSRLYLKNRQLADAAIAAQVRARFAACGMAPERIELAGPTASTQSHLAEYGRVDIGLDPFPYPGCTTSVEAHYMGVPVLTLRGDGSLLRLNESIASNLGLADWVAQDPDAYVARAVAAAAQLPALADLRRGLRERMQASALLDAQRFSTAFADALWGMWRARG